ncbi:hypothetical protein [Streptomyces griseus]
MTIIYIWDLRAQINTMRWHWAFGDGVLGDLLWALERHDRSGVL